MSKIETGRVSLPIYETRQRIHAALGTSEDDLAAAGIPGLAQRKQQRIDEGRAGYSVADSPPDGANPFPPDDLRHAIVAELWALTDPADQRDVLTYLRFVQTRDDLRLWPVPAPRVPAPIGGTAGASDS